MLRLLTTKVTSLEIRRPAGGALEAPRLPPGLTLSEEVRMSVERYRHLYRSVGDPHHWTSRLMSDENLKREIHGAATRLFTLDDGGSTAGWFELELRPAIQEVRIVHFGVMPDFRGRGLAHVLIAQAIAAGFAQGADRLIIETNTLDHPAALPLYRRHGFRPYATRQVQTPAIESALQVVGSRT